MIKKLVTKTFNLLQSKGESFVYNGDYNKAYYFLRIIYFIRYIKNIIKKRKPISNSFWMDQSSASIKENISRYKKSIEKEQNIDIYPANSEEMLKNKKINLMINRFHNNGKIIEHNFA